MYKRDLIESATAITGAVVATGVFMMGSSAPAESVLPGPLNERPIDRHAMGYSAEQGKTIVSDYFKQAKAALVEDGVPIQRVGFEIVDSGETYNCTDQWHLTANKINALYCESTDTVVMSEAIIYHLNEVIPHNPGQKRPEYASLIKVILGHELGHAIQDMEATGGISQTTPEMELEADCVGGSLLRDVEPEAARNLFEKGFNWFNGGADDLSHGTAEDRYVHVFAGLIGSSCTIE